MCRNGTRTHCWGEVKWCGCQACPTRSLPHLSGWLLHPLVAGQNPGVFLIPPPLTPPTSHTTHQQILLTLLLKYILNTLPFSLPPPWSRPPLPLTSLLYPFSWISLLWLPMVHFPHSSQKKFLKTQPLLCSNSPKPFYCRISHHTQSKF